MDVHVVVPDVGFNSLGAFVVHDNERGCIPTTVEGCLKAAFIAPSFLQGMVQTRMALRS